jgi:hypothetical protein
MDQENVVFIHSGILLSHEEEQAALLVIENESNTNIH